MREFPTFYMPSGDDILLWPNGDWCFRNEDRSAKSDDFKVIWFGSEEYENFISGDAS